jgi:hypothetical protein
MVAHIFGTYYMDRFMVKGERRILKAKESGYEWVVRTLGNRTDCYKMFRMYPPVFDKLHNLLVESYGLKSTKKMSSVASLALFLYIVGSPQSVRHAENRFIRSMELDMLRIGSSGPWRQSVESLTKYWNVWLSFPLTSLSHEILNLELSMKG